MYFFENNEENLVFTIVGILYLLFFFIPQFFYAKTISETLKNISEDNRKMAPQNAYLILIPIFNLVYNFILVSKVSLSIKAELKSLNAKNKLNDEKNAYNLGITFSILTVCIFVPFANLAGFICFIIYWVKINDFKNYFSDFNNKYYKDYENPNSIF